MDPTSASIVGPPVADPSRSLRSVPDQAEPIELAEVPLATPRWFERTSSWLVSAIIHLVVLLVLALLAFPVGAGLIDRISLSLSAEGDAAAPLFTLDNDPVELDNLRSDNDQLEVVQPTELVTAASVVHVVEPTAAPNPFALASAKSIDASIGGDNAKEGDAVFFGTSASGRDFVFILDVSGSMAARDHGRFIRARDELVQTLSKLRPDQRFYVFLFNWSTFPMFGPEDPGQLIAATGENISKLRSWLYSIEPQSGTDPRRALRQAKLMEPSAIFLLSDGKFNTPDRADMILGWDASHISVFDVVKHPDLPAVQINAIAFEDVTAAHGMSKIAELSDGQYRFVPAPGREPDEPPPIDVSGPEYEAKTQAERSQLAQDILLLRRAERLLDRSLDGQAKNLVRDIDPNKLPKEARARLLRILQ